MRLRLNNKGYMLVEIILATAIAMGIAYFLTDLTIKLKNKNDDLLVKTLVYTDQAIIYNTIMKDLYNSTDMINCDYIKNKINIDKDNNVFTYDSFTNIVSEYAVVENFSCSVNDNVLKINIPINVKQLPDDDFNVNINYKIN